MLISGTGSVCCGRNDSGTLFRTGGYGWRVDDEGSGYAIGRDILRAAVRAEDGRGPATVLKQAVLEQLGLPDIPGLVAWMYAPQTGKKEVAALAPLLNQALERQDEAAGLIVRHAVE